MSTANICNYTPLSTMSRREIDRRFETIHRNLCYLNSQTGGGGTVAGANTGLVLDGTNVKFGQASDAIGNPALISEPRYIPIDAINGSGSITIMDSTDNNASTTFYGGEIDILMNRQLWGDTALYIRDSQSGYTYEIDIKDFTSGVGCQISGGNFVVYTPKLGLKTSDLPTAYLHIGSSDGSIGNAPIKLASGTLLGSLEDGAIEYDGTHYYATIGSTRYQLDQQTGVSTNFANSNLTFTGNRSHDVNQHDLTITNSTAIQIQANDLGANSAYLSLTSGGYATLSANAIFFSPSQDGLFSSTVNSSTPGTQVQVTISSTQSEFVSMSTGIVADFTVGSNGEVGITQTMTTSSSSANGLNVTANWDTSSDTNALIINANDTNSGAGSAIINARYNGDSIFKVHKNSNVAIGFNVITPSARLHIDAGSASAGTAPLKLTAGTNLTTPENGAFEFDGTNLYFTVGGVRKTITLI